MKQSIDTVTRTLSMEVMHLVFGIMYHLNIAQLLWFWYQ